MHTRLPEGTKDVDISIDFPAYFRRKKDLAALEGELIGYRVALRNLDRAVEQTRYLVDGLTRIIDAKRKESGLRPEETG